MNQGFTRPKYFMSRYQIFPFIFFFVFFQTSFLPGLQAQTNLTTGDIAFVGWNSSTTPDGFAFVTWVNLQTGTQIKFTNNGFLSSSSANTPSNARVQQQIIYWQATTAVPAGTVITISASAAPTASTGTVSYSTQSQGVQLALSNTGGRIFIYQGASDYASAPTSVGTFLGNILFGLNYQGATGSATWLTTGTTGSTTTYLPSDLSSSNLNLSFGGNANSGQYTGPRTGLSLAAYKASVLNIANWTTTTGTGTTTFNTTAFSLSGLPLTWGGFTANRVNGGIQLNWETISEQNTQDFEVQRSADGREWKNIYRLPATGNSNTIRKYSYLDPSPVSGNNFYRLQQRDIDGKFSFSPIVRVTTPGNKRSFSLQATTIANNTLQLTANEPLQLQLFNTQGQLIWSTSVATGFHSIPLNVSAKGLYILKGGNASEKVVVR